MRITKTCTDASREVAILNDSGAQQSRLTVENVSFNGGPQTAFTTNAPQAATGPAAGRMMARHFGQGRMVTILPRIQPGGRLVDCARALTVMAMAPRRPARENACRTSRELCRKRATTLPNSTSTGKSTPRRTDRGDGC